MDFESLVRLRQSCRNYNPDRPVEEEKLEKILECARLSPSACNAQPYHITVLKGEKAKEAAKATMGMGMNRFADKAPVILVISEDEYNKTAAIGAKVKNNDYRSIDIGILTAHITLAASDLGLSTCILGWLDDAKLRKLSDLAHPVRLVITLGYAADDDKLREKKRKNPEQIISFKA